MAPPGDTPERDRPAAPSLVHLGTMLFACVAVGLGLGYAADHWLGTAPWLILIGLGFGIAAAAVNFVRALRALNRTGSGQ
jgi:F0F1-type ATP synthase assembly protein I